eukprot:m.119441 g.119441  ORF g.119441 m.119441 type:complete len:385 (-) comp14317_c0_seq1:131-1285(-)
MPGKRRRLNQVHKISPAEDEIRTKLRDIQAVLARHEKSYNLAALQELALSKGGLLSSSFRLRIWPILANVRRTDIPNVSELSQIHKDEVQVSMDVNRSFFRFPQMGLSPENEIKNRTRLREQLQAIVNAVLANNPDLHYYQGFHEVCAVIMLATDSKLALGIMARLSTCHLRDFMGPSLHTCLAYCESIFVLLGWMNRRLYDHICRSGVQPQCTISWVLTWFSHDLDDLNVISRVFDACLASHPMFIAYISTSLILSKGPDILATECDFSAIHKAVTKVAAGTNMEDMIQDAVKIFARYPPAHLISKGQFTPESRRLLSNSATCKKYTTFISKLKQHKEDVVFQGEEFNKRAPLNLGEMLKFAMTGSVTAVGFTLSWWAAQAIL